MLFRQPKKTATTTVLRYYDVTKPMTLQVDVSEEAIGGVLLQEGPPVCFTSHTLDSTEKKLRPN